MPTPTIPAQIERVMSRIHREMYRRTNGQRGRTVGLNDRPVALVTTVGCRSGQNREWPVLSVRDGGRFVVVASSAGRDHHPAWYLDLKAEPDCTIQIGADRIAVTAGAPNRPSAGICGLVSRQYQGYEDYARRTTRVMPVVILARRSR